MENTKIKTFEQTLQSIKDRTDSQERETRTKIKEEKQKQLHTTLQEIKNKIAEAEQNLERSCIDPQSDSVRKLMDIKILQKQREACQELIDGLFKEN